METVEFRLLPAFPHASSDDAEPGAALSPWAIPLRIHCPVDTASAQPIRVGVPLPRGRLSDPGAVSLRSPEGREVAVQATPLARWSDGTVKWLLVEFILGPVAAGPSCWMLGLREKTSCVSMSRGIGVRESPRSIEVDTGAASFLIGRDARPLLGASIDGLEVVDPSSGWVRLTDARGRVAAPRIDSISLEARGPVRATARIDGHFGDPNRCRFRVRLSFFAGTGLVSLRLTLHNPRRARHRGGLWDLGDSNSMRFRELSLEVGVAGGAARRVTWSAEPGQAPREIAGGDLEIYQDSSGGENWRSRNHVNREGRIPCAFRGYRVRTAGNETEGLRAAPVVSIAGSTGRISAMIPEFWQQFPKALEVEEGTLRAGLFPGQFGDLFELQGGEQKTHALWLEFGGTSGSGPAAAPLDWAHQPAVVGASPQWYAESGVVPHLVPAGEDRSGRLDAELAGVVAGDGSFFARREVIDEYGWRNFGEVYADHEGAHYRGEPPVISHYNNQYDLIYGMLLQYWRTGDARWFELLDPLARHVVDIDIYHTDRDRAVYNRGLFWHTDHYRDAATCAHRAYSRANRPPGRPYGGGPCDEHNYAIGLLHYYYMTGDEGARESVLGLADWVIAMDDGRSTVLGLIDNGPTGHASSTSEPDYHGPGRGVGNSVDTLLDGWLLSGRAAYLEKAEALIRRAVHPADDIEALDLLDAERRWSYTVFLSALGRYLALKAESGELGYMYAYARAALLHYATWMLERESPYLDRPEELEFPTETWAAQDLRKANVLRLAAAHADGPLRARLLARGEELADRSWDDLGKFETRGVTRSVAILLREGPRDAAFRSGVVPPAPRPAGTHGFGAPRSFVAQKRRVLNSLKTIRGLAVAPVLLARTLIVGRD